MTVLSVPVGFHLAFWFPPTSQKNACLWISKVWMSVCTVLCDGPVSHPNCIGLTGMEKTLNGAWNYVMMLILPAVHVWRQSRSLKRFLSEKVSCLTCKHHPTNCTSCFLESLMRNSSYSFLTLFYNIPVLACWLMRSYVSEMTKAVRLPCAAQTKFTRVADTLTWDGRWHLSLLCPFQGRCMFSIWP